MMFTIKQQHLNKHFVVFFLRGKYFVMISVNVFVFLMYQMNIYTTVCFITISESNDRFAVRAHVLYMFLQTHVHTNI